MFEGSGAGLFAVRFGLLFALFLVPTFFMGGTLPLLLDGLVDRDASIGSRTSFLYGLNILGAVAGVLVTSYFAIPAIGMDGTSRACGAGNLTIGVIALAVFRGLKPIHAEENPTRLDFFFPAAAFGSGLLAIAYQVAWARYFSLFNTGTVYLTAILLAVFLLALAAGSFVLAPLLVLAFVLGVAPGIVTEKVEPSVRRFVFDIHRRAEGVGGYRPDHGERRLRARANVRAMQDPPPRARPDALRVEPRLLGHEPAVGGGL